MAEGAITQDPRIRIIPQGGRLVLKETHLGRGRKLAEVLEVDENGNVVFGPTVEARLDDDPHNRGQLKVVLKGSSWGDCDLTGSRDYFRRLKIAYEWALDCGELFEAL